MAVGLISSQPQNLKPCPPIGICGTLRSLSAKLDEWIMSGDTMLERAFWMLQMILRSSSQLSSPCKTVVHEFGIIFTPAELVYLTLCY